MAAEIRQPNCAVKSLNLPVVHQYSVFDEVEDVVKVSEVSDVDNLSPGELKKDKNISRHRQAQLSGSLWVNEHLKKWKRI